MEMMILIIVIVIVLIIIFITDLGVARHSHQSVVAAALRVVGNIVTGDDCQTQVVTLLVICGVSGDNVYVCVWINPVVRYLAEFSSIGHGCWCLHTYSRDVNLPLLSRIPLYVGLYFFLKTILLGGWGGGGGSKIHYHVAWTLGNQPATAATAVSEIHYHVAGTSGNQPATAVSEIHYHVAGTLVNQPATAVSEIHYHVAGTLGNQPATAATAVSEIHYHVAGTLVNQQQQQQLSLRYTIMLLGH